MTLNEYSDENVKKIIDITYLLLHYLELSGVDYNDYNIIPLQQFHVRGYTIEDVKTVITAINKKQKEALEVVNDQHVSSPYSLVTPLLQHNTVDAAAELEWLNFIQSNILLKIHKRNAIEAMRKVAGIDDMSAWYDSKAMRLYLGRREISLKAAPKQHAYCHVVLSKQGLRKKVWHTDEIIDGMGESVSTVSIESIRQLKESINSKVKKLLGEDIELILARNGEHIINDRFR